MKRLQRKDITLFAAQATIILLIMMSPGLISFITSSEPNMPWTSLYISAYWLSPAMVVYLLNFYVLVPRIYMNRHRIAFVVANVVLVLVGNSYILFNDSSTLPVFYRAGYTSFISISLLVNVMAIVMALSFRYMLHQSEKKQKEVEAELSWLKNQINPHFLFNTMNNISSLTQIDADEAQDAIMQLSDLLRYAMYDTNKQQVPLGGEINFLKNYIDLMQLRCNELTTVSSYLHADNEHTLIAPLLFISLVENAFKHGVDGSQPAIISISLVQKGDTIVFTCDNTNHPKPSTDRSGSGIGLENTRRRLQLLYPGRHQWQQSLGDDNIYHVCVTLKL